MPFEQMFCKPQKFSQLNRLVLNSLALFLAGIVPKSPYSGCQFEGGTVRISIEKEGKSQKIGR